MHPITLHHGTLGALKCLHDPSASIIKILGLPYASIPQRFARSRLCSHLFDHASGAARMKNGVFDATMPGASSIQPFGSVTSDAGNIPVPTGEMPDDEDQSEECLNLSIHLPSSVVSADGGGLDRNARLPVLVYIHGGAYFLGSANRPYYSPVSFLRQALRYGTPVIYMAVNYRLGALGFWHAQGTGLVPENNGLHDQLRALEWIKTNISGFGGDADNITALGQSAGGESLAVLSMSEEVREKALFRKSIALSGTPVTMPAMTPAEHTQNFLSQADKLGISTRDRAIEDVAEDVIKLPVGKIRDLAWVGSPCTNTSLFPFEKPTMSMMRNGGPEAWKERKSGVEAMIVGSTTYDGGISFNMMSRDSSRTHHSQAFTSIATDVLGKELGLKLSEIYGITQNQSDPEALQRICLFESDIGFFFAALATCQSNLVPATYLQIFDLPNPFDGPLSSQGNFATHTFDITTLLGGYDEQLLPEGYGDVIASWRRTILDFVVSGKEPCARYVDGDGKAIVVGTDGVREVGRDEYMHGRREQLLHLADKVDRNKGWDILWVDVCRRFLMKGE